MQINKQGKKKKTKSERRSKRNNGLCTQTFIFETFFAFSHANLFQNTDFLFWGKCTLSVRKLSKVFFGVRKLLFGKESFFTPTVSAKKLYLHGSFLGLSEPLRLNTSTESNTPRGVVKESQVTFCGRYLFSRTWKLPCTSVGSVVSRLF